MPNLKDKFVRTLQLHDWEPRSSGDDGDEGNCSCGQWDSRDFPANGSWMEHVADELVKTLNETTLMTPQKIADAIFEGAHRTQTDLRSTLDLPDEVFDALRALSVKEA